MHIHYILCPWRISNEEEQKKDVCWHKHRPLTDVHIGICTTNMGPYLPIRSSSKVIYTYV